MFRMWAVAETIFTISIYKNIRSTDSLTVAVLKVPHLQVPVKASAQSMSLLEKFTLHNNVDIFKHVIICRKTY